MKVQLRFLPGDEKTQDKYRIWYARLGSNDGDRMRMKDLYINRFAKIVSSIMGGKSEAIFGPVEVTGKCYFSGLALRGDGILTITILKVERSG